MNNYVLLILSQIMIGGVGAAARYADLPAEWLTIMRCGVAACLLLVVVCLSQASNIRTVYKFAVPLSLTGLFMGLNWLFFFKAVLSADLSTVIIAYNATPLFVVLSAFLFLRELPSLGQAFALGLIFVAVSLVVVDQMMLGDGTGILFALLASALYAQVTVVGRYLKEVPPSLVALAQCAFGGIVVLPYAFWEGPLPAVSVMGLWVVILIGVGMTAVPYLMYFRALQKVSAIAGSLAHCIYTITTFAIGIVWFQEPLTPMLGLCLAAVALAPLVDAVTKRKTG